MITAEGPTQTDARHALRRLLWWLTCSKQYPRQSEHIAWHPDLAGTPDYDFIVAAIGQDGPNLPKRKDVVSDTKLNEIEVPFDLLPPESWQCWRDRIEAAKTARRNRGRAFGQWWRCRPAASGKRC